MNKNRLGEEHKVKISKNNSLTSRAGFCLSSEAPGSQEGWASSSTGRKPQQDLGAGESHLGPHFGPSMIHTKAAPGEGVV